MISFRMFRSAYAAPSGVISLPEPGESEVGTHMVAAGFVWSDGGEALRFKYSWVAGWGDGGYGVMSRTYLDRYMVEAWAGRNARVGPTRHKFAHAHFAKASGDKEFAKTWMLENPRERVRFRHEHSVHRLHLYETWSCTDVPVEVIEVRDGRGTRLGWPTSTTRQGRSHTSAYSRSCSCGPPSAGRGMGPCWSLWQQSAPEPIACRVSRCCCTRWTLCCATGRQDGSSRTKRATRLGGSEADVRTYPLWVRSRYCNHRKIPTNPIPS